MLAAARSRLCRSVSAWSGVFASIYGLNNSNLRTYAKLNCL